jgi:hypothetical protein
MTRQTIRCSYREASEKAVQIEAKKKEMVELLRFKWSDGDVLSCLIHAVAGRTFPAGETKTKT